MEAGSSPSSTAPSTQSHPGGGKTRKKGRSKGPKKMKPKMTKEERRAKYTAIARGRREAHITRKRDKHLMCFRCRKAGHSAENCPQALDGDDDGGAAAVASRGRKRAQGQGGNLCYKCGSVEHRIQQCPKIKQFLRAGKGKGRIDFGKLGDLPYANCYVCNQSGHLASHCPKNDRGLYPRGGSCRECGSVDHFAADCPEKMKGEDQSGKNDDNASVVSSESVTIDRYLEEPSVAFEEKPEKSTKKRKVVNF
ncbi:hypothetical protein ACHAWF_002934 [Thalassiosira exigua]